MSFKLNPLTIPPNLVLRRYLVGGYVYEHIPGEMCMTDEEWDLLARRLSRCWHRVTDPHKKILKSDGSYQSLRSIGYLPEEEYPDRCVSAAYRACGLQWVMSKERQNKLLIRVQAREDREYFNVKTK